jgi:hypothetical protein
MAIEEELRLAVRIYRHIPGAGSIVFSAHDAMEWAGIFAVVAADPSVVSSFNSIETGFEQRYGRPPRYQNDGPSLIRRVLFLCQAEKHSTRRRQLSDIIRFAGGMDRSYLIPSSLYVQARRKVAKAGTSGEHISVY